MKWERRKTTPSLRPDVKTTELPYDYLKLVEQTITQAMLPGLTEMKKIHPVNEFSVDGAIFSDEVVITITLSHGEKNVAATTVHASTDYNPDMLLTHVDPLRLDAEPGSTALEKVLSACVDGASSVFDFYLDPKHPERIEGIANHSLGSLEEAPFDWTLVEQTDPKVWVKMDKSNPKLDRLADQWLAKHDPSFREDQDANLSEEAEEFLEERLEAIKKAKDGGGNMGGSGPITH